MRRELELQLANDFPFMRRNPNNNQNGCINDSYSAFGCECGDGWYNLLSNLCTEITSAYAEKGLKANIEVSQVKEKYGSLRFYSNGSLNIEEIISKYEDISERTCELCGQPGKTFVRNEWWMTRCDACYNARYPNQQEAE